MRVKPCPQTFEPQLRGIGSQKPHILVFGTRRGTQWVQPLGAHETQVEMLTSFQTRFG